MRATKLLIVLVVAASTLVLGLPVVGAAGGTEIYESEAAFVAATGATAVAFPADADAALTGYPWVAFTGYSCTKADIALAGGNVNVDNKSGDWICFMDADWDAPAGNFDPWPTSSTITSNGSDDFVVSMTFSDPQYAVAFELLTNSIANETVTLHFSDATSEVIADASLGTTANTAGEFIGFRSNKPIVGVEIVTTGGAVQNEGMTGIWTSPFYLPPTTSCPAGQTYVTSLGSTVSLGAASGYPYEIDVSGTFFAGGVTKYDIQADAEYSEDAYQRANAEPWTDLVRNYEGAGEGLLEMKVDGGFVEWGAFSSAHEYSIEHVATASDIDFNIYDTFASNNTGGLCVEIEAIALRSVSGGGQIIHESFEEGDKGPYKVSFGGYIDDIDGGLECSWQVNLHNVAGDDLDKSKFHSTSCSELNTWPPTSGNVGADGVSNFTMSGTFNGDPGYTAIFRMEDYTEPGAMDTVRITITGPDSFLYDTWVGNGGVFPSESNNVGTARAWLDNGNIQINFYE